MPRSSTLVSLLIAAALFLGPGSLATAHPQPHVQGPAAAGPRADAGATKVVDGFHAALARGDTAEAAGYLSDALIVFEQGDAERSKAEYAASHLPSDAAFEQAVGSDLARRTGGVSGDLPWIASEGRTRGRYKDRDVDRINTETMVLRRVAGTWKIVHVHWSSRAASAAQ